MKKTTILAVCLLSLGACNGEYKKQIELAKKEKCELFTKYEQLKSDSANSDLRREIKRMEKMLDTRKELSENEAKFTEELQNHKCN